MSFISPITDSAYLTFLQAGAGAVTRSVQSKLRDTVSVKDFGAVGDGITDDLAAFQAAIASFSTSRDTSNISVAGTILVPAGTYYLSNTLTINRSVILVGETPVFALDPGASQIVVADNRNAIHIPRWVPGVSKGAGMVTLRNLSVRRTNTGGTVGSGLLAESHFQVENCKFDGFRENGIRVITTLLTKNANESLINNATCSNNGSHGFYITGDNGNACCFIALNVTGNGGWGIYDDSFLGNTYIAAHNDGNTLGSYKTTNANANCVFVGCYEEPGQPAPDLATKSLIIGGTFVQGFAAGNKGGFVRQATDALGNPVTQLDTVEIQTLLTSKGSVAIGNLTVRPYQSDTKGLDIGAYTSLMNSNGYQAAMTNNCYMNGGYKYTNGGYQAAAYVQQSGGHEWYVNSTTGSAGTAVSFSTAYQIGNAGEIYFPMVGTTASAANAFINNASSPANQLLRSTSSRRYKSDIEPIEPAIVEAAMQRLRPIWYRSKAEADNKAWSWYGLIAEEVAEVEPRLVHWSYAKEDYDTVDTEVEVEREEQTGVPGVTRIVKSTEKRTEPVLKAGAKLRPDGVQYERLAVMLLAELQALRARVSALEAR